MDQQPEQQPEDPKRDKFLGTPFKNMSPQRKVLFVVKLALCIVTFGLAFPNIMAD